MGKCYYGGVIMGILLREFLQFLKEYKVVSLAAAFILGSASTTLVNSLVKDIFMPLLSPLFAAESWREAAISFGTIHLAYGSFLAELINFIILAFIVFFIAKKLLRMEQKEKITP